MKNGLMIDSDGTQRWFLNDKLHRENDLPAIIYKDGSQIWWRHGQCHRENDLPAVIDSYGYQSWYLDDQLHRDNNLPANIYKDGHREWWHHGEYHRENGPAIIRADGHQAWYRHGKEINVKKWIKDNNLLSWETWEEPLWVRIFVMKNGLIIDDNGTQRRFLNGLRHRDENDLPAIIRRDGRQYHRENGPAIIG